MMHKITALLAISILNIAASAEDLSAGVSRFELWKIESEQALFEIQVARSDEPTGSILLVNRSSAPVDILDLNMSVVRTIKPFQTVDITASFDTAETVAVEINGGVVYLELVPGTSIITLEKESES